MKHRSFLGAWLLTVWFALWRDVSVANLVSGLVVAAGVIWLFPPPADRRPIRVRPVAMARFVATTAWSIVRANFVVAWEVITPVNRINEGVVSVQLASNHPIVITLVSHAIILAPGTMVVDIETDDETRTTQLYVHVLHLRSVEDVRAEILRLEALALAAVSEVPRPSERLKGITS